MIVLAGLVGSPVARAESPVPIPNEQYRFCMVTPGNATPSSDDLSRLFDHEPAGVVGADYQRAHRLPDGRVLWTFQDAEVRQPGGATKRIHNLGVLQDGPCFSILYGGTRSNPRAFLLAADTTPLRRWFWPLDSALGSDGRLYIYMAEMHELSPDGYLAHTEPAGVRVAVFDPATNSVHTTALPPNSSPSLYGWSVTEDERWTYLYAQCYRQFGFDPYLFEVPAFDASCSPDVTVARVPRGDLWAPYQYWDGARWQADPARAQPLRGLADQRVNASQFRFAGNRFYVVDKEGDWWGDTIHVYVAERATGPFTRLASIPEPRKCEECNTFFADWIPPEAVGRPSGSLVYGLSHNRWDGAVSVHYRPTFHEVRGPAYPLGAGETLRVHVDARAGAAALNVTAVGARQPGYLTVYPCDVPRPEASALNYGVLGGPSAVANLVVTGLSDDGDVCIYAHSRTDVVVDLAGTFDEPDEPDEPDDTPPNQSGDDDEHDTDTDFQPIAPTRVADTRATGRPTAGGVVEVALPADLADAGAVVMNLTAVAPDGPGYLTAYPCDRDRPSTSNLNYLASDVVAALAVVSPSESGTVCVHTHAGADVVVDAVGAFGAALDAAIRSYDSRTAGDALPAGATVGVPMPGDAGDPIVLTATAVAPDGPGFLTVYPCDQPRPTASNVNFDAAAATGRATANLAVAARPADGYVCVYTHATAHVVVDVAGALPADSGFRPVANPRRLVDTRLVGFDRG